MRKLAFAMLPALLLGLGATIGTAAASPVTFDSLPSIDVKALDAQKDSAEAPQSIPAGEKVDGLFVVEATRMRGVYEGVKFVGVLGSEPAAKAYAVSYRGYGDAEGDSDVCVAASSGNTFTMVQRFDPDLDTAYRAEQQRKLEEAKRLQRLGVNRPLPAPPPRRARPAKPPVYAHNVTRVRRENLRDDEHGATLEVVDAWIDPATLGARVISRKSFSLAKVASGPGGLEVLAGRSDSKVMLVVGAPKIPTPGLEAKDREDFVSNLEPRLHSMSVSTGGSERQANCGHVRVDLEPGKVGGTMATLLTTAILPPAKDAELEPPPPEADATKDELEEHHRIHRMVRARLLKTSVSMSQTSSEKSPVLSVSFAWASKDEHLPF